MKKRSFLTSLCAALFGALLPAASAASAALAINSQESSGVAHHSASSPITWSFTNTSGTLVVVGVAVTASSATGTLTISGVTYGGVSMTAVPSATGSYCTVASINTTLIAFYYLEGAATGANTVSATVSAPGASSFDSLGAAISFTGEKSSGPVANGAYNTQNASSCATTSTAAAVSITSTTSGDYVVNAATAGSSWTGATSPATESAVLNESGSFPGDNFILSYQTTSGGTVSTGNTVSAADVWGIAGFEVIAAPATTCKGKLLLLGVGC